MASEPRVASGAWSKGSGGKAVLPAQRSASSLTLPQPKSPSMLSPTSNTGSNAGANAHANSNSSSNSANNNTDESISPRKRTNTSISGSLKRVKKKMSVDAGRKDESMEHAVALANAHYVATLTEGEISVRTSDLSIYLSIYQSIYLSIYLSIYRDLS